MVHVENRVDSGDKKDEICVNVHEQVDVKLRV